MRKFIQNVNGKFCKIIDTRTNIIVCAGIIVDTKPCVETNKILCFSTYEFEICEEQFISFDYKHYFHQHSDKYTIKINNDKNIMPIHLTLPNDYIVDAWSYFRRKNRDIQFFKRIDVFLENTISELDPEIKNVVKELLNSGFKTTSSCSGHDVVSPYITIAINKYDSAKITKLHNIIKFCNSKYQTNLCLLENCVEYCDNTNDILIKLTTTRKSTLAYDELNKLIIVLGIL